MPISTRNKANVLVGYADIWLAAENTAEPAHTTLLTEPSAGAGWTPMGFTDDGLEFDKADTWVEQNVEELEIPAGWTYDHSDIDLKFTIGEDTTPNLAYAVNGTLTTVAAGASQIAYTQVVLSKTLQKYALCFLGVNEFGFQTRVYIPSVGQFGNISRQYKRVNHRAMAVDFKAACTIDQISVIAQSAVHS